MVRTIITDDPAAPSIASMVRQLGHADAYLICATPRTGSSLLCGLLESSGTRVEVISLDSHFARNPIPRLDFVKIDVEGMEYEVLRGGRETWKKHRPVLYFETLREFESIRRFPVLTHIERFLTELRYNLYRPEADGSLVPTTAADSGPNTAALPAA